MLVIGYYLGADFPQLKKPAGTFSLDLFTLLTESFSKTNAGVGLMIMSIGGFVAYVNSIGASDTLVNMMMKPLGMLKSHPNIAAAAVIPIGQFLFIAIPSAAGLGLLLMASVFPILIKLGVSRLTAVSVITGTTSIGLGPASAITASASEIIGIPAVIFFVGYQLPLFIPLSILLAISFYFVNGYYDKKQGLTTKKEELKERNTIPIKTPRIYAIIPILPIIILIVFSDLLHIWNTPLKVNTTTAMFISLIIALVFEIIRFKNIKKVMVSLKEFWNGMGNIFKTVVTLIIAAEIFSKGLLSLGFIDGLVTLSQSIGLNAIGIGIVMSVIIFAAAMLMGSGNAAFFSFAPIAPKIAAKFGIASTKLILPMNFAASMGRTISPVAGVLIACAEIAEVNTFEIVKRNLIPLVITLVVMLTYHFI